MSAMSEGKVREKIERPKKVFTFAASSTPPKPEPKSYKRMMAATNSAVLAPEVLWAQRNDCVYLTVNVSDVENPKIDLTPQSLTFSGVSHNKNYEVKLDFFKEVDPEVSASFARYDGIATVQVESLFGAYLGPVLLAVYDCAAFGSVMAQH
jgi:hypothetical protein